MLSPKQSPWQRSERTWLRFIHRLSVGKNSVQRGLGNAIIGKSLNSVAFGNI